ncbi:LysR family transcriptional regulator [Frateuria aurantia]
MNLHHLAIFNAVAEHGSIATASKKLHLTQPAISRELKDFEARLGVVLFERLPRGMRLTYAGSVLREYAVRLFKIAETAESTMKEISSVRLGHLSVAASNTIGTYVLPRVLATFRRQHPGVQISLFVGNNQQVSQGVADMRFALGFIEGDLHVDGLALEEFQYDELVPVVAADDPLLQRGPLVPGDIAGQPLLMREAGSGSRDLLMELLHSHAIEIGSIMEFGNSEALKQAALHGGGIAWLSTICIRQELADGRLERLPIRPLVVPHPFSIVQRPNAQLNPATTLFLATLKSLS